MKSKPIPWLYAATAFGMGLVWFLALHASPFTGPFFHTDWLSFKLKTHELILLLCLSSLGVALTFRRLILRSESWLVGALLPYYGAILFISSCALLGHALRRTHEGGSLEEVLGITGISIAYGLVYALLSFHVVVPMGMLSHRVMQWAASR